MWWGRLGFDSVVVCCATHNMWLPVVEEGLVEHPGVLLKERFLEPLGISASELAQGISVTRSTISRLTTGKSSLTPMMAKKLGAYFSVPARWWLEMQFEYEKALLEGLEPGDVTPIELDGVFLGPKGPVSFVEPEEGGVVEGSVVISFGDEETRTDSTTSHTYGVRTIVHDDGTLELTRVSD